MYKDVEDQGNFYKVYQPLDLNEELTAFPGEPNIPSTLVNDRSYKDNFLRQKFDQEI